MGPDVDRVRRPTSVAATARRCPRRRTVILPRDVEGLPTAEICTLLDISAANQRVLLHRARSKVRQALEDYYRGDGGR